MARRKKLKVNQDLVALLQDVLDQAKAGEITEIFFVTRSHEDIYNSGYETEDLMEMTTQVKHYALDARLVSCKILREMENPN